MAQTFRLYKWFVACEWVGDSMFYGTEWPPKRIPAIACGNFHLHSGFKTNSFQVNLHRLMRAKDKRMVNVLRTLKALICLTLWHQHKTENFHVETSEIVLIRGIHPSTRHVTWMSRLKSAFSVCTKQKRRKLPLMTQNNVYWQPSR